MPRTPKQIAEYIDYYKDKPKEEREWALKNLEEIEGKPLKELIEYSRRDGIRCRKTLSDDTKELIKKAIRADVMNKVICMRFGINHNTVTRIKNEMREAGEELPERRGRRPREEQPAEKQPEAYPGQINDDEPIVEDDVKAYIPHETEIAGDCKAEQEKPAEKKSLGECLSDLGDAFCKIFGVQPTEIDTDVPEAVDYVAVLVDLMTFVREKFGEDITIGKISCGRQESTSEIGFYKGDQLYYLGLYAMAKGEEE